MSQDICLWVGTGRSYTEAGTIRTRPMNSGEDAPPPHMSRWSRKCNSFGIEIWREHHQPKGSATSHLERGFWVTP